jgi:hypothetical protein
MAVFRDSRRGGGLDIKLVATSEDSPRVLDADRCSAAYAIRDAKDVFAVDSNEQRVCLIAAFDSQGEGVGYRVE